MNWFGFHLGDWVKKTTDLTLLQEGIYLRLVCWCYVNEQPLPLTLKRVREIARSKGSREHDAVQAVLYRFFEQRDDGWHHSRVDEEIARYARGAPDREMKRMHAKDRQQRARERRVAMFVGLRAVGIVPSYNAKMAELSELCAAHGVTLPVTRDVTRDSRGSPQPTTRIQEESTLNVTPDGVTATRAGEACKAMRKGGFASTNPSDPRLHALLEAGATNEELAATASEAAARGKGWAWVLATVSGRRADAARMGQEGPKSARRDANAELLAQWVPALASRGSGGS